MICFVAMGRSKIVEDALSRLLRFFFGDQSFVQEILDLVQPLLHGFTAAGSIPGCAGRCGIDIPTVELRVQSSVAYFRADRPGEIRTSFFLEDYPAVHGFLIPGIGVREDILMADLERR